VTNWISNNLTLFKDIINKYCKCFHNVLHSFAKFCTESFLNFSEISVFKKYTRRYIIKYNKKTYFEGDDVL